MYRLTATPAPATSCFMPWLRAPGLSLTVSFQQVYDAPDAEAGTEGNYQRLQYFDCTVEKLHLKTRGRAAP